MYVISLNLLNSKSINQNFKYQFKFSCLVASIFSDILSEVFLFSLSKKSFINSLAVDNLVKIPLYNFKSLLTFSNGTPDAFTNASRPFGSFTPNFKVIA